jgi:tetratricopeptide (TPR) repeat protein/transcriptional regulator with XRE-family HTH domain
MADMAAEQGSGSFGALLRRLRTSAGLTQEELAYAAALSPRAVSDLERGINQTTRKNTARLLADALGLAGREREEFEAAARGLVPAGRASAGGGLPTDIAAAAGGAAAATRTLPRDVHSFIGRQGELLQLADIAAATSGVVGIHAIGGMAGVGKTAFAVHAAHELAPRFPDGQIFLPLHGHTPGQLPVDPADALASLLQTAGVAAEQIPPGLEARMALWRDHLAGKQLLLLLDDAADSEQVGPLLPGTGGCLVLVTSRRHLTALDDAHAISLDTLPPDDAAALLVRLAARPGLDSRDPAVSEIIRLCGYLPLAVGMLARQLYHHPAWSPADLAGDLTAARNRLEFMHAEDLSVAAAFDLSYADLNPAHQRLFRRLGLHPGTEVDAWAAAALDGCDLATARRYLEALYGQYLLTEPTRGRYRFHDLIRQHSRALAAADPPAEAERALTRLFGYYRHSAEAADRHLARYTRTRPAPQVALPAPDASPDLPDSTRALSWARTERANLLALLDHTEREYSDRRAHDSRVITLTAAMASFIQQDGPWTDGIERHARAAEAAQRLGDRLSEAGALNDLGILLYLAGDYQNAAATLQTALAIYRHLGNRLGQANTLHSTGSTLRRMADYTGAMHALEEALRIYRDLGDRPGEAGTLNDLGIVRYQTGDYPQAAAALEESLSIYRVIGDRRGQASTLSDLGATRWRTGNYDGAAQVLEAALAIHRDLGDRLGQANALTDLGIVGRMTGDYANAIDALEAALSIASAIGYRLGQANACSYLGETRRRTGDVTGATEALKEAVRISIDLGDRQGEASALNELGAVRRLNRDYRGALDAAEAALRMFRDLGHRHGQADTLNYRGVLRRVTSDYGGAADDLVASLALYREIGLPGGEAEVLNELGALHLACGDIGKAEGCHRQALDLAGEIGSPHDRAHALAGLARCSLAAGHLVEAEDSLWQAQEIYRRIGAVEASSVSAELGELRGTS